MTTDSQIICAEAPIALIVASGFVHALTPCCQASAKGSMGSVVCRACYNEIDDQFGDCWRLDDERGWSTYQSLVGFEIQVEQLCTVGRTNPAEACAKAGEVVAYARAQVAGVLGAS